MKQVDVGFRPLGERCLVRRTEEKDKTPGGLIIPPSAKEKPLEADVIAVGAGKVVDGAVVPLTVKPGNRVLLSKYAGVDVKLDGVLYLIIREEEILGVVEA